MSRLDDELKLAFRREEPNTDFANRVMQRINAAAASAPKRSLWQRLISIFEPPRLRWLAVGAAASLLFAVAAYQQGAFQQNAVEQQPEVVAVAPQPDDAKRVEPNDTPQPPSVAITRKPARSANHKGKSLDAKNQLRLAAIKKERLERAEGEAAKKKVMLALHIASSALNDAQKVIEGSGPESEEPLNNR